MRRPVLLFVVGLAWSLTAVGAWWMGRQGWVVPLSEEVVARSGTSVGVRPPLIVGGPGAEVQERGPAEAIAERREAITAARSLRLAREARNPLERYRHLLDALTNLTPEDGDRIRDYIESMPPGMARGRELPLILNAWARVDGPAAVGYALENADGRAGRMTVASALQGWAAADPVAALEFAEEIRTEAGGPSDYVASVIGGWAQEDPFAATRYIEGLPAEERERYLGDVGRAVIGLGQDVAMSWALGLADPTMKSSAFAQVVRSLGRQDPEQAAALVARYAGEDYAAAAVGSAAFQLARQDPAQALGWVQTLPEGEARASAEASLVREWARNDPFAAAEYVMGLAETNNAAVAAFARSVVAVDPMASVAWAQSITDETQKERTLISVGQDWFRQDPAAAAAWLETTDLPPEARQQVLNPPPERQRGRGMRGGGGGGPR